MKVILLEGGYPTVSSGPQMHMYTYVHTGVRVTAHMNTRNCTHTDQDAYTYARTYKDLEYLLLKDPGQRRAVSQLDKPHHIRDRPLQRIALKNQSLLICLA